MITYLLYELLPVWLTKLGQIARESLLYRLLANAWGFCAELVRQSLCARLWNGSEALRARIEGSRPFAWFDAFLRWLTQFAGKAFGWVIDPVCSSRLVTSACRMPRFNLGWLFGGLFLIMYLVPGESWNNLFALAFSCLVFLAMLLDAWNRRETAFRARDLGVSLLIFLFAVCLSLEQQ